MNACICHSVHHRESHQCRALVLACKQSTHCLHESYADISQNFSIIPSEHAALHADAPMHGLLFHECLSSIPLALHGCLHTPLAEPTTFT